MPRDPAPVRTAQRHHHGGAEEGEVEQGKGCSRAEHGGQDPGHLDQDSQSRGGKHRADAMSMEPMPVNPAGLRVLGKLVML